MWKRAVRWIGDWRWILGTFIYGKVFGNEEYKPTIVAYTDGKRFVSFKIWVLPHRMKRLLLLWSCRLGKDANMTDLPLKTVDLVEFHREVWGVTTIQTGYPYNGANGCAEHAKGECGYAELCRASDQVDIALPDESEYFRIREAL